MQIMDIVSKNMLFKNSSSLIGYYLRCPSSYGDICCLSYKNFVNNTCLNVFTNNNNDDSP